jgi:hypothetical protein
MSGAGSTSPLRRAKLIGGRTEATMRGDGTAAALAAARDHGNDACAFIGSDFAFLMYG